MVDEMKNDKDVIWLEDKSLSIARDPRNWILVKHGVNKNTGAPTRKNLGYWPDLEGAAIGMLNHRMDTMVRGELKDVLDIVRQCKEEVIAAIKGYQEPANTQAEEQNDDCDW